MKTANLSLFVWEGNSGLVFPGLRKVISEEFAKDVSYVFKWSALAVWVFYATTRYDAGLHAVISLQTATSWTRGLAMIPCRIVKHEI